MLPLFNFWNLRKFKENTLGEVLLLSIMNASDNNFTESEPKKKRIRYGKRTKQPDKLLQDCKSLADDGSKVYTYKSNLLR